MIEGEPDPAEAAEGARPGESADGATIDQSDVGDGDRVPMDRPARANGSVLMAAMLGLAYAMGTERRPEEPTEQVQPAEPDRSLGHRLGFGPLPPLED